MDLSSLAPSRALLQDLENNPELTDWIKRSLNQAEANDLLQHYHLDAVVTSDSTTQVEYKAAQGLVPQRIEKRWCRRKEPIGHGLWGQVWLEQEVESCNQRAVKIVRKDSMKFQGIDYKKEILALAKFSKRHYQQQEVFVKFIGWCEKPSDLFIYMEYFEQGDLEGHINGSITEDDIKDISTNLLNGLRIMHHEGFAHRDLKPGNIFVVQRPPAARWWVKIGDFGISKRVNHKLTALYTQIGTRDYMAPEVTGYLDTDEPTSEYNKAVDMWSLGCVLYKVATQVVPFPTPRELVKFCSGGPFPEQPLLDRIAAEGVEFVKGLLVPDPQNRLTAESALQTSWLSPRRRPTEDSNRIRAQLSSDTKEAEAEQTVDNGTGPSEAISGISTSRLALQPENTEAEETFESLRISASESEEQEPDEDLDASEEEENTLVPSSQSSSLPKIIRLRDEKVAEKVTRLLETPVANVSKKVGGIYIISPLDPPGVLQVCFSIKPRVMTSYVTLRRCYGELKVITARSVPYARRVVTLLLAEFSNNRCKLKEVCRSCMRSHDGLLNIDKESLLRSLEKWTAFVESFPYSDTGELTPDAKTRLPAPALKRYLRGTKTFRSIQPAALLELQGLDVEHMVE